MSGHFSALSVLAIAYSIMLQVEANKKMAESIKQQEEALRKTDLTIQQQRISIEKQTEANLEQAKSTLQQALAIELQAKSIAQQNKALEVQSKSLEAQIEELKASREESEKQTEEFFIQNMNVTLDRYYNFLNDKISNIHIDVPYNYADIKKRMKYHKPHQIDNAIKEDKQRLEEITNTLMSIYLAIDDSEKNSYKAYNMFMKELKLRVNSSAHLLNIKKHCPELMDSKILDLFH